MLSEANTGRKPQKPPPERSVEQAARETQTRHQGRLCLLQNPMLRRRCGYARSDKNVVMRRQG
jgi:hypothetical protein